MDVLLIAQVVFAIASIVLLWKTYRSSKECEESLRYVIEIQENCCLFDEDDEECDCGCQDEDEDDADYWKHAEDQESIP
jgi:hypothetical protein